MHRKLLPLALMYADNQGTIEGRTRLQKMVFLLEQELKEQPKKSIDGDNYNFIPYDYGPFSKSLYDDIDWMSDEGLVNDSKEEMEDGQVKYNYEITEQGKEFVENQLPTQEGQLIFELARNIEGKYNDVLLSNLIEHVYSEYPKYAENSVW